MAKSARVKNDLLVYQEQADSWWSESNHTFKTLKALSPFKISLIKKYLGSPRDLQIVDLGCGGGLLSVPFARDGAKVIGVDISSNSLQAARRQNVSAEFVCADLRRTGLESSFADWVLLADVLDHLSDYQCALQEAYRLLKPGGHLYVGTINRTVRAKVFAVFLGEGLGLIPKGTHDWRLFIQPEELVLSAKACGFSLEKITGEGVDFVSMLRKASVQLKESKKLSLAYSAFFRK